MKIRHHLFVRLRVAVSLVALVTSSQAANYWFDVNGTEAGYGTADATIYNWLGIATDTPLGPYWGDFAGTANLVAWPGGSNQAYFTGAGAGTNYTVRLGADGSSGVTLQNFGINMNASLNGASGLGNVTIGNPGDTGVLTINASNSVGAQGGGTLIVNNPIDLNGKTMNFRGGEVVINGNISGAGTTSALSVSSGAFGLTTGTLTLNGNNTYGGSTVVGPCTLKVTGGAAIPNSSSVSLSNTAAVFDVQASETVFALTAANTYATAETKLASGAVLTVSPTSGNNNYYAKIMGDGGLTVNGNNSATVQLLGTTNTYSGATTINNGARFNILANGALSPNTAVTVSSGGQLYYGTATYTIGNSFTIAGNGDSSYQLGALRLSDGNELSNTITLAANARIGTLATTTSNVAISGKMTGNFAMTFSGRVNGTNSANVFTLSNTGNDYTGTTTVANSDYNSGHSGSTTLKLGASDVLPNGSSVALAGPSATYSTILETNGFSETINGLSNSNAAGAIVQNSTGTSTLIVGASGATSTYSGVIRDNGGTLAMKKTGSGALTLSGDNSFSGGVTLSQGTLNAGHQNALGTGVFTNDNGTNTLTNTSGSAITLVNAGYTINSNLIVGGTARANNIHTGGGAWTLGSTERILSVNNAAVTVTVGGAVSGSLRKDGAGTLVLAAANTGLSSLRVTSGTLQLTGSTAETSALIMGHVSGAGIGKFILGSTAAALNQTIGSLETQGSAQVSQSIVGGNGSVSTLIINQVASTTYAGAIGGVGTDENNLALTKTGIGTLTLTGGNSYSGATTINQGCLALVGAVMASPITVADGAFVGFSLGSPATSSSSLTFDAGSKIRIVGTPNLTSYTLMSASSLSGTPVLETSIPGYELVVDGAVLKLNATATSFESWVSASPYNLNGSAALFDADPDNDGLANGLEWILGGDPTLGSPNKAPTATRDGSGNLVLTFTREEDSIAQATLSLQYDTELSGSFAHSFVIDIDGGTDANGVNVVIDQDASPDAVTVTIPAALANPSGKLFARLFASQP